MDFTTRYKKLNARQKEAVDHIDGPLMVVAGPGTGKTELLSMRVANILAKTDVAPENILCLTFTESGANAMRERLSEIIGRDAYKVAIHTFHSFGSEVINQYGEYFYHGADFRPADEVASYEIVKNIFDSLDYNNPLASKLDGEYTHIRDTLQAISELKKSGLTNEELLHILDDNDLVLDSVERDLADVFASRISANTIDALAPLSERLAMQDIPKLPPGISPLANVMALSLAHAIDEARSSASTKPITAWKNTWLEKDDKGEFVFKDRKRSVKLRTVSYVYYQYLVTMQESRLYDFDDMVLRVVHAMEVFPDLRYNLQEKYLYILVDEFQDTNLAQSRILHNLTSTPTGDSPNIMVVGDDDQAIYSFQGAEVGNILNFRDKHEQVQLVTLTDNYRSASPILQQARSVITLGSQRLEHYIDEIDKELTAHHTVAKATVELAEYAHASDERHAVVEHIQKQIKSGVTPNSIAVLARRHYELVELLPYFHAAHIAVNYERRDNVLSLEPVTQLLVLARIIHAINISDFSSANALLPQLLAHPAWAIAPQSIWQLSLRAYKNNTSWLEEMAQTPEFQPLHLWLITLAQQSAIQPLEYMLDELTGIPSEDAAEGAYVPPLYAYFFGESARTSNPEAYLIHLESLRTIRAKLREYRPDSTLHIADLLEFVDVYESMGAHITSVRPRSEQSAASIQLMTAHKSKGLEFDHVYVVGAVDTMWGERVRSRSRMINYPQNLPLAPSGDSIDERLRLFFVAMTRARNSLHISYSRMNDSGKETLPASFLVGEQWNASVQPEADMAAHTQQLQTEWYQPLVSLAQSDMKTLLAPQLENYKLSATHFNTFLDITRGGPLHFLLNNLLRFPSAMSPNAAFGSAIHRTLQRAHAHMRSTGKKKPLEDILHDFETNLSEFHLPENDASKFQQRGDDALSAFLAEQYNSFTPDDMTELNFNHQQSHLGDAHLTGSLDLVRIDNATKTMVVTDYKTSKPSTSWQGKTDAEKVKLHKYKQQLMFYKLLVENSRDYRHITVEKGVLQFVEPSPKGTLHQLSLDFSHDELAVFSRLVEAVYAKIIALDLPDTSEFSQDYKGILAFEESLLK